LPGNSQPGYPNASSGWWARFTFNGITRCQKGSYVLVGGEEVFAHRSRHRTPISGSI